MIKAIVCDLDGTLIRKDDTIEAHTLEMLRQCIRSGKEFMIATGRDINMVIDVLDHYQLACDMILNNGAQFLSKDHTTNELYPMDDQAFIQIATILHQYGYLLAIHTDHGKYALVDRETFWDIHMKILLAGIDVTKEQLPEKTFTTRAGYLRDFHQVSSPEQIVAQGIKVLKIDARHLNAYSVKGVRQQLNIPGLDISSSFEDNIEITSQASNKGKLLKKVIGRKAYQMDEVAVFGDGENDADMLGTFAYSFAPKNASLQAKAAAKIHLAKTNEEGAVGEGLEWLIQKGFLSLF